MKIASRGQSNKPLERPPSEEPIKRPKPPPKAFTNKIDMALVRIDAGTFWMGSPAGEKGRDPTEDEGQHFVRISRAFYLGKHPVTVEQFKAFVRDMRAQDMTSPAQWTSFSCCE